MDLDFMVESEIGPPPFLLTTILLFLSNVPLKDYGYRIGDEKRVY